MRRTGQHRLQPAAGADAGGRAPGDRSGLAGLPGVEAGPAMDPAVGGGVPAASLAEPEGGAPFRALAGVFPPFVETGPACGAALGRGALAATDAEPMRGQFCPPGALVVPRPPGVPVPAGFAADAAGSRGRAAAAHAQLQAGAAPPPEPALLPGGVQAGAAGDAAFFRRTGAASPAGSGGMTGVRGRGFGGGQDMRRRVGAAHGDASRRWIGQGEGIGGAPGGMPPGGTASEPLAPALREEARREVAIVLHPGNRRPSRPCRSGSRCAPGGARARSPATG